MRKRRNKNNYKINTDGYIKTYFRNDIERILTPSTNSIQNSKTPYVHHEEAEKELNNYLEGDEIRDKQLLFTGLTGSGKTSIIRHVFGCEDNTDEMHEDDKTVIILINFNRSQDGAETGILSNLRSATSDILNKWDIDDPNHENEKFYEYVEKVRRDCLFLDPKHTNKTPFSMRLATFRDRMPIAYESCRLQYVLDHEKCGVDLVVMVVDNIEAFASSRNESKYLQPVISAFKLAECIGQRRQPTKWCFNLIIVCRHHIWRILKGDFTDNSQENALLQSYVTTQTPYDLSKPVGVNEIIEIRQSVFSEKYKSRKGWDVAVDVVNTIMKKMEGTIGDFILQLELKDFRKSFSKMQELILHNGLQRVSDEEIVAGSFQIGSPEQFDLSRVNLIRVLGLGDRKYYTDMDGIIPNLLFNEQTEGLELYPLLTLKYFLIRSGFVEPAWDNPVSVLDFYDTMESIFEYDSNKIEHLFKKPVEYLLKHRMLLRSADQSQEEVPGLSLEEIKKVENVYVSGGAVRLWEELGKSSALFQLYMDDIWLEEDSYYFEEDGNDIEHCFSYLRRLFGYEKRIANVAENISKDNISRYVDTFGVKTICGHLIDGLISSLEKAKNSGVSSREKDAEITLALARKYKEREIETWENDMLKRYA